MSTPRGKRNLLDFKQKRKIIDYAMKHHKSTQQQIPDYFSMLEGGHVKRRAAVDIISNKETYDSEDDQGTPHIVRVNNIDDLQKLIYKQ